MANPRSPFLGKGRMHPFIHLSILFHCRSSISSNCLVFHTSGGISSSPAAFLFLIFLRTESSSSLVKGPSLMSNCWLIILVIGSCVTFGGFPSRFSKCCFHSFTFSCWLAAFNFALAVLFLPLKIPVPKIPIFQIWDTIPAWKIVATTSSPSLNLIPNCIKRYRKWNVKIVAVTDLFLFANQCPRRAIRLYTD